MDRNPYLKKNRLAEVIAAITTLANYRFYKLSFSECAKRIVNEPSNGTYWGQLLREHPEFFRITSTTNKEGEIVKAASLVWRRQARKLFDTWTLTEITREQYQELNDEEKKRFSRKPLNPDETTALISIAVNLHERAIEESKAGFWHHPIINVLSGLLGVLVGAWVS